jgi:hypothetical protein
LSWEKDATGGNACGLTCLITLLNPQSFGTVRLASTDPKAAPLLDPRYLEADLDQRVMVAETRHALEIFASPTLGPGWGRWRCPSRPTCNVGLGPKLVGPSPKRAWVSDTGPLLNGCTVDVA